MENALKRYKEVFWDGFHRPKLFTPKFLTIWENLEPLNDELSGPLYAVYKNNHCDYFFEDKNRFPWMNIPEDFMHWYSDGIGKYKETVEKESAITKEEEHDKEVLLFQVDIKMELADIAYEIQCRRLLQNNS